MRVSTYLPFVEVSHDRAFDAPLWDMKLDEETMVVFTRPAIESVSVFLHIQLAKFTISLDISGVENAGQRLEI